MKCSVKSSAKTATDGAGIARVRRRSTARQSPERRQSRELAFLVAETLAARPSRETFRRRLADAVDRCGRAVAGRRRLWNRRG
ncbi:hypothetical protein [Streptomyces sp. NPDC055094]